MITEKRVHCQLFGTLCLPSLLLVVRLIPSLLYFSFISVNFIILDLAHNYKCRIISKDSCFSLETQAPINKCMHSCMCLNRISFFNRLNEEECVYIYYLYCTVYTQLSLLNRTPIFHVFNCACVGSRILHLQMSNNTYHSTKFLSFLWVCFVFT